MWRSSSPSMANPGDFAYTVKQQADIVRIVGDYVKLKKAGAQNYSGLCPFHSEKTPSFSVHATRQFYHCFGCGVSGDVFSFVQKIENITFPEAVRLVAQKLGIALPKVEFSQSAEKPTKRSCARSLLDVHERACLFSGVPEPPRRRARPRIPGGPRPGSRKRSPASASATPPTPDFCCATPDGEFDEEVLRESGLFSWKEAALSSRHRRAESRDLGSAGCPSMPVRTLDGQGESLTLRKPEAESPKPPPCTPSSATASCSPSPTKRAASSPSPGALSPPTKKPGRSI